MVLVGDGDGGVEQGVAGVSLKKTKAYYMDIPKITLDTNVLQEYWKNQENKSIVERLLEKAEAEEINLAVTARICEDVPNPPLAEKINELPELNIHMTGSTTRFPWKTDRDLLCDEEFDEIETDLRDLFGNRKNFPDQRDWDHLQAHYLLKRDVFLTWDKGILDLAQELQDRLIIVVMKPEDYFSDAFEASRE